MLKLEALQAGRGDALLITFDGASGDRYILVDGGPGGTYAETLEPRLDLIRQDLPDDTPVALDLVMVSHIDDDHIRGILEITDRLEEAKAASEAPPYLVDGLWLNAFKASDFAPAGDAALSAALAASVSVGPAGVGPESAAVVASIPQAIGLTDAATVLQIPLNADFASGMAMADANGPVDVDLGDGLTLSVLGPGQDRLDALRKKWAAFEAARREKAAKKELAAAAAAIDRSVYNLSSIVVLVLKDGHTMLLTGDARSDDLLAYVGATGLERSGVVHLDVLKMPHHGSVRNVTAEFFDRVKADHYVISADGKNGNPDVPTLEMLTAARGADEYTIHLTKREGRLETFFAQDKANGRRYDVDFRPNGALSNVIQLP